jgi:hypothetical protein
MRGIVLRLHYSNSKVCLPVIPGEGAVPFKTVWFFPINTSPEAEGKISTNLLLTLFSHTYLQNLSIYIFIAG